MICHLLDKMASLLKLKEDPSSAVWHEPISAARSPRPDSLPGGAGSRSHLSYQAHLSLRTASSHPSITIASCRLIRFISHDPRPLDCPDVVHHRSTCPVPTHGLGLVRRCRRELHLELILLLGVQPLSQRSFDDRVRVCFRRCRTYLSPAFQRLAASADCLLETPGLSCCSCRRVRPLSPPYPLHPL